MALPKGSKNPNAGRKKGIPNKITTTVKETILEAFEKAGGVDYLLSVAHNEPKAFLTLLAKCVPNEISGGLDLNVSVRAQWLEEVRKRREQ